MEIMSINIDKKCKNSLIMILAAIAVLLFPLLSDARDPVLIVKPEASAFEDVKNVIADELGDEFVIKELTISSKTQKDRFANHINDVSPKLVVLMDNKAIGLFKYYQSLPHGKASNVPSIACMGVFVEKAISGIKNSTGVSYEVPPVTSIVGLRVISKKKISKVGVIHREFMNEYLKKDIAYCKREHTELIPYSIPGEKNHSKLVKKGLKYLIKRKSIDVLWVPNDSALLKPDIIKNIWVPMIDKYKIPVIVCVGTLASTKINLGSFAVLPDHEGIGRQVAEMVFEVRDNKWSTEGLDVVPPLSVYKIINLPLAEKSMGIKQGYIGTIDHILE